MLFPPKIKIAYCLPSLYIAGGMERVLTLKANYFAETFGYEIYIINTDGKNRKPFFPLSPKVRIIHLDINFDEMYGHGFLKRLKVYLKKQPVYRKKLRKCLYELKPDITVSMLRREISFITSIHDGSKKIGEAHSHKDSLRGPYDKKAYFIQKLMAKYWMWDLMRAIRKLDRFVILTHEDGENWGPLKNLTVINNPLSFLPGQLSDCSAREVIAVGRYLSQKGFDLLIDAWRLVNQKHPDWVLRIYGEGMRELLEDQIQRLQLKSSCILEQPVVHIEDQYLKSSIFVLSSRYEGFGMVLPEAMACGLPVVSFSSYGPREIIRDGEDGLIVENGNISAFAEKICFLIENESIRKRMGQNARKNIERLKIENIAAQWKVLFESLTGGEGSKEKL